jgi:glutamate racemase
MTAPYKLPPSPHDVKVGLFDSGVGGLSILRALRRHLPQAQLLYVADSANAPYGEKSEAFILERSQLIADFLLSQGAQLLVVACNTATAAAVHALRERHPHLPIVGIEPGVKPAVLASHNKKVGVMATPATLSSAKFARLVQAHEHEAQIVLQPCPGLAAAIETGELDTTTISALVTSFCAPLREADVDTVVLGCTHYPFVAPLVAAAMGPGVQLVDTAEAVARRTVHLLAGQAGDAVHGRKEGDDSGEADRPARLAQTHLWTSGSTTALAQFVQPWLEGSKLIETLQGVSVMN